MLETLSRKQKIIFFIILSIMIVIIIYYIYSTLYSNDYCFSSINSNLNTTDLIEPSNNNETNFDINNENPNINNIVIYICGAVKENKVVTLKENSRICDAIDAAGGLTSNADLTTINLAYILEDGEKIYIPKKGETIQTDSISSNSQNSSYSNYSSSSINNLKLILASPILPAVFSLGAILYAISVEVISFKFSDFKSVFTPFGKLLIFDRP